MDRSRIGIVIPAVNEAETIYAVVTDAAAFGTPIVVDDGSSDETADRARLAGAVVVSHKVNRGYDEALNSGFEKAAALGSQIVVTLDADGQHDPGLIREFLARVSEGADVVVGARDRRQRLAEHFFSWYTRWSFGISDPLCGMKAYRTTVYEALGHFDSYRSIGTELMIFAARSGFNVQQVEFQVRNRNGSSRFGSSLKTNCRILRAMFLAMSTGNGRTNGGT